jgi:hypothetical protein
VDFKPVSNQGIAMHPQRASVACLLLVAATAACGLQINTGGTPPSAYALNYPDSSRVTSGRVVRFAGNYGLLGPSPAFVFRDVNGQVTGQMLVWYRRFEPIEAGGRSAADSAAQWARMQSAMRADRARVDSTYHCTAWAKGYQEGKAWVCRVPEQFAHPNWTIALARLDSLALARRSAEPTGGRRLDPIAPPPPPPPANPGVARLRPRDGVCMDGGSWNIVTRDARGTRTVTSPQPGAGCNQPDGPAKTYDQAGWRLLREFGAAMKWPTAAILGGWHGSSLCVVASWNAACANEDVVYDFRLSATGPERVTLHASTLVSGAPRWMYDLDFAYDSTAGAWSGDFQNRRVSIRWTYRVKGDSLIGQVVERPSGRVARNVTATRVTGAK